MYGKEIERVLIDRQKIATRIKEIGEEINRDFAGQSLTVVCTLRGALIFCADLVRELTVDVDIDFIAVSSYGAGTSTSGEVKMIKDLSSPIKGKNVLIIEDIIDTGVTLVYMKKLLMARDPKSVKICALLDKPSRRKTEIVGDYVGFEIANEYVVGYGLDYNQKFRNLPDVCVLSPTVYGD